MIESLTWVRLPDVYYALQRNADYSPTGPKGEKTHISFALRVDAVPAFVMTPDARRQSPAAGPTRPRRRAQAAAARERLAFNVIDGIVVPAGPDRRRRSRESALTPPPSTAGAQ